MAGKKPDIVTYYRTDFGNITFGVDGTAVTPAGHVPRGVPHPIPASMTDFLPVIDRRNAESCR